MTLRTALAAVLALPAAALPAAALAEPPALGTAVLLGEAARINLPAGAGARTGDAVLLILPDPAGDRVALAMAALGPALEGGGDLPEGWQGFALAAPAPQLAGAGFALAGPLPLLDIGGGSVRLDLTGDGEPETLAACLTTEGVALTAVQGDGAAAETIWQDYVDLGYDVEPTCE